MVTSRNYTLFPHMWTVRRILHSYGKLKYTFKDTLYFFPTQENAEKAIKKWIDSKMIQYGSAITYMTADGYNCVDIKRLKKSYKFKAVQINSSNITLSNEL